MNKKNSRKIEKKIFKKGSNTFFTSSLFFPQDEYNKIAILYAFVRTVDDFVDAVPQKKEEYTHFKQLFINHYTAQIYSENPIIIDFVTLMQNYSVPFDLIQAFFNSMEMDIHKSYYETLEDLELYMYGTAEVIGLMIAKIIKLPENSYKYAQYLGKALQWINCLRDISEDISLHRVYIPLEILTKFSINKDDFIKKQCDIEKFSKMIRYCISLYFSFIKSAEKGYDFLPFSKLLPIKTASDMYKWTANVIYKNPLILYKKKVKPSKIRIFFTILRNFVLLLINNNNKNY